MTTPFRRKNRALYAGVALVAITGLFVSLTEAADPQASTKTTKATKAALSVAVTQPVASEWPLALSANGNITAWQEAVIGAEAGGLRLTEVLVDVGDHVKKGELLARLQSDTLAADLAQSKASLQEAQATLAEASANAERARQLKASGAMSAQQITQLLTGESTARARLAVLDARISADEIRLSQTRILAPDSGTISSRLATLGAVVSPGQELFRLIRRDRLEWRAEVPAADLLRLKPGLPVTIHTADDTPIAGVVRMLAPTVDALTRNAIVYVDITKPGNARAGMFARGEFQLGRSGALTLPQSAVQLRDGFHYVYRVGDDSKLTQRKVGVGRRDGDRIEITSGLDEKARVVMSGVGFVADGDTVRVVEQPAAQSTVPPAAQPATDAAAGKTS